MANAPNHPRRPADTHLAPRALAALLCVGIASMHVIDQQGFPGTKAPGYAQTLYYALELGGVGAAGAMFLPGFRKRWLLALGISLGPMVGFVLSRSTGLPNYSDDIGNWGEAVGIVSLILEGTLAAAATYFLLRERSRVTTAQGTRSPTPLATER